MSKATIKAEAKAAELMARHGAEIMSLLTALRITLNL